MDWETLDSKETFQAALTASHEQLVVVFKHSTRCSISRMALKLTTSQWDLPATVRPLLLDLLTHRDFRDAQHTPRIPANAGHSRWQVHSPCQPPPH